MAGGESRKKKMPKITKKTRLTQDQVKELIEYIPNTGVFNRIKKLSNNCKMRDIAITKKNGYQYININGGSHLAHRIAFLYMDGCIPKYIDHIDGNRSNNVWTNLRRASSTENARNRCDTPDRELPKNVYLDKRRGTYYVQVCLGGKKRHTISGIKNLEEALDISIDLRKNLFGEFDRYEYSPWDDCGWTKSRYFGFIRSALRRASVKYPVKYQVLQEARRPYSGKDKRTKWEYSCSICKKWFKTKDVEVDHIKPVGSLLKYSDLDRFCRRLFCEKDNLQVLCKSCHGEKTHG